MRRLIGCLMAACTLVACAQEQLTSSRTKRVRQKVLYTNAYAGQWYEERYGERCCLALKENGKGVLFFRGLFVRVTWEGDGKGHLKLVNTNPHPQFNFNVVDYRMEDDVIDLNLGKTTRAGFTGRLTFKSDELPKELEAFIAHEPPKPELPISRKDLYQHAVAELKKNKESAVKTVDGKIVPGIVEVTDLAPLLDPRVIEKSRIGILTVDMKYPQIETPHGYLNSLNFWCSIDYGMYATNLSAEHSAPLDRGSHKREQKRSDPACQVGIPQEVIDKVCQKFAEAGIRYRLSSYDYGKGDEYWREDSLYVFVGNENYEKFSQIVRDELLTKSSERRLIAVDPVEKFIQR